MTGRLLLEREGYKVNQPEVIRAAAEAGGVIELNAHPRRFDLDWMYLGETKKQGGKVSINPDAHNVNGFDVIPMGIGIARKGWLTKDDVLNTLPLAKMTSWLKAKR